MKNDLNFMNERGTALNLTRSGNLSAGLASKTAGNRVDGKSLRETMPGVNGKVRRFEGGPIFPVVVSRQRRLSRN